MITSLVYVSTATVGLSLDDFLAILDVSQRNNQRFGISGLLVFNGTNFMQCLEGDRAAVNDRLHHIGRDDRHNGLSVIDNRELSKRQFAEWDMGGRYLPEAKCLRQVDLVDILSKDTVSDQTRTSFQSFRSLGNSLSHQ